MEVLEFKQAFSEKSNA